MSRSLPWFACLIVACVAVSASAQDRPNKTPPEGFTALFNGKDLTGWKGLVGNPLTRAKMVLDELATAQGKADAAMRQHWRVDNGDLVNDGGGPYLCTKEQYADFEMWVDWKIQAKGDSGIYLRGSPQVQIWDPDNAGEKGNGADKGSGALWNNQKNERFPLVRADNPIGQWNTFYIKMVGERVTVKLNGKLVTDNVVMENYWDRKQPIFPKEQIELQTHGGETRFRNLYIRVLPAGEQPKAERATPDERLSTRDVADSAAVAYAGQRPGPAPLADQPAAEEGFEPLFNGKDLTGWIGATDNYEVRNGAIVCKPGKGGNLLTKDQYDNFVLRFEFKLPPAGNNGIAVRTSGPNVDTAYHGMEIQVLDDTAPQYKDLHDYQYHGSIYGVVPAKRGFLKPLGEWNSEEILADKGHIKVTLNGTVIVDADISKIEKTVDGKEHPGLHRPSGYLGFAGHNDPVEFRNVRVKKIKE